MKKWSKQEIESMIAALETGSRLNDVAYAFDTTTGAMRKAFARYGFSSPYLYYRPKLVRISDSRTIDTVPGTVSTVIFKGNGETETKTGVWVNGVRIPGRCEIETKTPIDLTNAIRPVDGFVKPDAHAKAKAKLLDYELYTVRNVTISNRITKIIVCPDAHHPYHDKKAWGTFLEACKRVKPDVLVIIGDFVDMLSVSAHAKKARDERRTIAEIEAGNKALDEICALGIKRVVYVFGNHESRFSRYLNANAPELDGLLLLEEKLRLKERGIEYVPYGEYIKIGKIAFTHDVGRCGINCARQSLQDFGDNIVVGHSHRASVVYGGTVEGDTHVGLNVGHLLDINQIDYTNRAVAKREWQTGFGLIYQTEDGTSFCNFVPIINGECIADGKHVKVS